MPDLFLSHSSSDVDAVRRLRVYLEAGGYSCWMAPDDVSSGKPWAEQIVDAIRTCRAMVVVLSERSIGSEHVSREVGLAVQAGRAVLPVRIERVLLTGSLAYLLNLVQWVDAFPGPIDSHIDDIGGRVADLVRPMGGVSPPRSAQPIPPPASQPVPPRSGSPEPVPARAAGGSSMLGRAGVVGGGVMVVAGSVLPWSTLTIGAMASSVSGIDREGVGLITALLGIVLVGLGIAASGSRSRALGVLAIVVAVLAGLMGIAEALHQRQLDVDAEGVSMALGIGLFVLVAGAAVAGLAGLALALRPVRTRGAPRAR